jgi:proteasome lid subunit RPN8/RPN11
MALHSMRNIAVDADRFDIDPAAHIALSRSLRGTDRVIIGCYHSNPNGRAEPSARDMQLAAETGFVWLIQSAELRGFAWTGAAFSEIGMAVQALA